MKNKRRVIAVFSVTIIIILIFLLINQPYLTGKSVLKDKEAEKASLNLSEKEKISKILLSGNFIKDIPKKGIISLQFFSFINGKRIWQDEFLMERGKVSNIGSPDIRITLHSKYLPELNENNLCDVIKKAKTNGDLGFYSNYGIPMLFIKYAGMMKYRNCFGF